MAEAFITPKVVRWARERRRLTVAALAESMSVPADTLLAWEEDRARPTLRQAQVLAQKLAVPFGYLFLSSAPVEKLPLPDLRTVSGAPPRPASPDFTDLLNDVLRKQDWYREYQQSEAAEPVQFVGRFTPDDDPTKIAVDIRGTLSLDDEMRQQSQNWEEFLRTFIRRAEDAGVLVLRSGIVENNTHRKLDIEEFRGFAISDPLAPLVFVNAADAKAAQIFTLAHELAHLWVGASGISNLDYMQRSFQQQNYIDRLCDQVAAETLLPRVHFLSHWRDDSPLDESVQSLAALYRVSAFVVLRRAYENDKISFEVYRSKYRELMATSRAKSSQSGGNFYATLLARNSNTFTVTLLVAAAEGRVPYRDAAQLLNVKIRTLPRIQERLLASGLANG